MLTGFLDSAPLVQGTDGGDEARTGPAAAGDAVGTALARALVRAERLDALGAHRVWFTELHAGRPGDGDAASSDPLLLAALAAQRTTRVRLGAGGVMSRNHSPFLVAERARLVAALAPGRVDLGLGSASGGDDRTDAWIRRTPVPYESFADDVRETLGFLDASSAGVAGSGVEPVLLVGSRAGGELAGRLGLPVALAGHVAPDGVPAAVRAYRESFRPRPGGPAAPHVVACLPVLVAECDEAARHRFRSVQRRALDRVRHGGRPLVACEDAVLDWSAAERYRAEGQLAAAVTGSPATVAAALREVLAAWGADELLAVTDLPCAEHVDESDRLLLELTAGW
ncbi:MsnO8 family LLM class oxidoreductase [Nocardioides sp. GY 10127]|uniref:MsnO8 family LLM class oxidoreductase n=1 Tax=Nocardioides sp. GY 10127 TaxID=2569762 RepID=UPI0010A91BFA|nr:MsnO8 family LLM class oxidoreductase [Nocardioides sp. GY 10127]TIC81767.1 MsnO8 family LLM class oxidoreductase [Nocardioides sp. GY 10127]